MNFGGVRSSVHSLAIFRATTWCVVILSLSAVCARASDEIAILKGLSLDELADVEVTIASRRPQKIIDTSSAVYVISADDIKRSGAKTIPDLLRMVPGVHVASIDANKWAISARGFNSRFAGNFLVLIDGRSVYTPLFSGVYWNAHDLPFGDIDRIEVIRGPGAAVWGANAVTGVINILTKDSADAHDPMVTTGIGTEENRFVEGHVGGAVKNGHYRVYGKSRNRDTGRSSNGRQGVDGTEDIRAGFRTDLHPTANRKITVQGDVYEQQNGERYTAPNVQTYGDVIDHEIHSRGQNVLGRWSHVTANQTNSQIQVFVDKSNREQFYGNDQLTTYDIDLQQSLKAGRKHLLTYGGGYRRWQGEIPASTIQRFESETSDVELYSVFLQDSISLSSDLDLTVGSKFEHHDYHAGTPQPTARLMWRATDQNTVWMALSKAVRLPGRADHEPGFLDSSVIPPSPATANMPALVRLIADDSFQAEELDALELGWRYTSNRGFFVDLATYYNQHKNLRSIEPLPPTVEMTPVPHIVLASTSANNVSADSYGFELVANWDATDWWRLLATYSTQRLDVHIGPGSGDNQSENRENVTPESQFSLRSQMKPYESATFDMWLRYVNAVDTYAIPEYLELDFRFGWIVSNNIEFALVGRNILDPSHLEYRSQVFMTETTEVEREAYVQFTWRTP